MARRRSFLLAAVASAGVLLSSCVFPSPSPGTDAQLNAVAMVSATNAWAVGQFSDGTGDHELMEHWNGQSWQEVFLPLPIGHRLEAVTVVNAHNVWAVGDQRTLHFGGLGWHSIPNPPGVFMFSVSSTPDGLVYGLGVTTNQEEGVYSMTPTGWRLGSTFPTATAQGCSNLSPADITMTGTNDFWMVGDGSAGCTFALHFSSGAWHSAPIPQVAGSSLVAVSAVSDSNVWAVGEIETHDQSLNATFDATYTLHWNGNAWTQVPGTSGVLSDVVATHDGVWAVGTGEIGAGFPTGMLIMKWNGTAMIQQQSQSLAIPGGITDESHLSGVSEAGGVVTSVGSYAPNFNVTATLTERRNAN